MKNGLAGDAENIPMGGGPEGLYISQRRRGHGVGLARRRQTMPRERRLGLFLRVAPVGFSGLSMMQSITPRRPPVSRLLEEKLSQSAWRGR